MGVIHVTAFGMSDVGCVRKNNEDSFAIFNLSTGERSLAAMLTEHDLGPHGSLLLVADGLGGEACGEVASSICAETVPKRLYENLRFLGEVSDTNFALLMKEAIEFANQLVFEKAQAEPTLRGMATTATAAALWGAHVFVAHVGDSRAYIFRQGDMVQLTRDQTYLNYLADIGVETAPIQLNDSRRNILTDAVGTQETVTVPVTYAPLCQHDTLLLCSDGLYSLVPAADLLAIATRPETLPNRASALIELAKEKGGLDNITAILAELDGPGLPPPRPRAEWEVKQF